MFFHEFKKWKRNTEIVIDKIFGDKTRNLKDFDDISYSLWAVSSLTPE